MNTEKKTSNISKAVPKKNRAVLHIHLAQKKR